MDSSERPVILSGFLLGCGLMGVCEDVILRQMFELITLSPSYATYQFVYLMFLVFAFFHLWIKASHHLIRNSVALLSGGLFIGLGTFIIAEGSINHFVLNFHHFGLYLSREIQFYYDGLYLAAGMTLAFVGKALIVRGKSEIILYRS